MHSRVLMIVLALFCYGCVEWDAGYTENRNIDRYLTAVDNQIPLTYSIQYVRSRFDEPGMPDDKCLREKLESALIGTGLFSEVSYGDKGGEDSYHIEFHFRQDGMTIDQSVGLGLALGCTLVLVPMCEVFTLDGSAILFLQGKPIYSTAKAEEFRRLWWLPVLPAGIILNPWSVWNCIEHGNVNALVNDISVFHNERFLKDVDVEIIKE